MEISIKKRMNSLNGGIPMCISRLADTLAEQGVDQCIKELIENANKSQEKMEKHHLHFLISGIKSINPNELAETVGALREYPPRLRALQDQWDEQFETHKCVEAAWYVAAGNAKTQILLWQKCVSFTEVNDIKRWFSLRGYDRSLISNAGMKFLEVTSVLRSPKDLARKMNFFHEKITSIKAGVERSYVSGFFDESLSPPELDKSIHALLDKQQEVIQYEAALEETKVEWDKSWDSYLDLRKLLDQMLWFMPESARVALFWLCHPELEYQSLEHV